MKLNALLSRHRSAPVPLLSSACLAGNPKSWPSEQLERLLTPSEIDQVRAIDQVRFRRS
ncbi:Transposase [Skermania piniformis]